jgi:hypothetical protein
MPHSTAVCRRTPCARLLTQRGPFTSASAVVWSPQQSLNAEAPPRSSSTTKWAASGMDRHVQRPPPRFGARRLHTIQVLAVTTSYVASSLPGNDFFWAQTRLKRHVSKSRQGNSATGERGCDLSSRDKPQVALYLEQRWCSWPFQAMLCRAMSCSAVPIERHGLYSISHNLTDHKGPQRQWRVRCGWLGMVADGCGWTTVADGHGLLGMVADLTGDNE